MAFAVSAAPVAAQQWQGAWSTTFGQVRLIEDDDHVYGDYGDGTIEGIIDRSTGRLRAVFRNADGRSGYAELKLSANGTFAGAYSWENEALPRFDAGVAARKWTGNRTAAAAPPIRNFRLPANRSAFVSGASAKYRGWINGFSSVTTVTGSQRTSNQQGSSNTATGTVRVTPTPAPTPTPTPSASAAVNPLVRKFPKLRDYPADFVPRSVEIDLRQIDFMINVPNMFTEGQGTAAEIYGTYGIYAYCETASSSRPLPPMAGAKNRVFDRPRSSPARVGGQSNGPVVDANQGIRRFALDQQCMNTPGARFAIQVQTNLNEAELIPARDHKFSYRAFKFYLDQMPNSNSNAFVQNSTTESTTLTTYRDSPRETRVFLYQYDGVMRRITLSGRVRFLP
ncbi:hypothetical protein CHX26_09510 [Porphyrobacter sp. HT-58-2]|nr:hypothetical protein CHX26_09510 [Porphyrobacter sp. HT-58-2]